MSTPTHPAPPVVDEESAPYWDALRRHEVLVQACPSCRRRRFPRMPACPACGSAGGVDVVVAGTGVVYSWIGVHRALTAAFAQEVPYVVVTVDLDGGGRLFGRMRGRASVPMGAAVEPELVDHPTGWTELCFRTIEAPAAGASS